MVGRKQACRAWSRSHGYRGRLGTARSDTVRRLYLTRISYFIYYRVSGQFLDVVALWHSSRETHPSIRT